MLKKLALAMLVICSAATAQQLATGTTALEPGQIYNSGNIVQQTVSGGTSSWVGAVYQDNLTCWAAGDPGYCGPNAIVRPGNLLNFSYGSTYVYQQQHITNIVPSGSGLQVNGYNFGFTAKNGNGWDGGGLDQLTALVRFWDNTGNKGKENLLYGTSYDLNYKFDWTNFNYSETFNKPLAVTDVGLVQYGFIGRDNNFWAGPYGPEVYNVSFNVKYSVDPCATNPLYSPTCSGYLEALNKLLPPASTVAIIDPVITTSSSPTSTTTIATDPVTSTVGVTSTTSIGQPSVVASVVSAPAPVASSTSTSTSSSSTSTSSSSQTSKETTGSGGNTNLALSVISKNSERDAAGSAVAQSAVAQAQQAANQAQQEAQSVAASAVANSTTMNATSTTGQSSSGNGIRVNTANSNSTNFTLQSGQSSIASVVSGPLTSNSMQYQQQSNSTGLSILNNQSVSITSASSQQSSTTSTFALPLIQPQQPIFNIPNTTVQTEQQTQSQTLLQNNNTSSQYTETYSIVPPNFLTDKSNPLTDIIEGKQNIPQNSTIATIGSSVNKNTSDNEIAGGVDINKMALAPIGYGSYLNLAMRDASFYAPKEVYKNQKNVDNARALRQLSSDRLHQDMVEQQYRR